MKTLQFKTNIKCSGCISKVTPVLNKTVGEDNWEVDVTTPEKYLTITSDEVSAEKIINVLKEAGYNSESVN